LLDELPRDCLVFCFWHEIVYVYVGIKPYYSFIEISESNLNKKRVKDSLNSSMLQSNQSNPTYIQHLFKFEYMLDAAHKINLNMSL
jgi:hypothetical protein